MKSESKIPTWLYFDFWSVLTAGEIYPRIRAIALHYNEKTGLLLANFYFDREPTDFDRESADTILSLLATHYSDDSKIRKIEDQCYFSTALIKDLDALDGFVYTRREYEMQDRSSHVPTYF